VPIKKEVHWWKWYLEMEMINPRNYRWRRFNWEKNFITMYMQWWIQIYSFLRPRDSENMRMNCRKLRLKWENKPGWAVFCQFWNWKYRRSDHCNQEWSFWVGNIERAFKIFEACLRLWIRGIPAKILKQSDHEQDYIFRKSSGQVGKYARIQGRKIEIFFRKEIDKQKTSDSHRDFWSERRGS